MNSKILFAALVFLVYFASGSDGRNSFGRDLLVEVLSGKVPKKDNGPFAKTDAYMSVTVCNEKKKTPVVKSSLKPVWNWSHKV